MKEKMIVRPRSVGKKLGVFAVSAALLGSAVLAALPERSVVYAGSSDVEVATTESMTGSINQGTWFVRGVTYGNNSMVFGENSTADTRVASKIRFENLEEFGFENCLTFDLTLTFTSISENARFLICFGMNRPTSAVGEASATSIAFRAEGEEIFAGVLAHGADKEELFAFTPFPENGFGKEIRVTGAVHTDGGLLLTVNGKQLVSGLAGFATEGYMGFGQTGNTVTEITDIDIIANTYDRPENTEASADFANGEYNANEWYSSAMAGYFKPTSLAIEEGALRFRNVSESSLSTLHKYSNFEMTFDVPYIQRTAEFSAAGDLLTPVSGWIGISMGAQSKNGGSADAINNATFLYIEGGLAADRKSSTETSVILMSYGSVVKTQKLPETHHFWSTDLAETNGCMQIKLRVEDGSLQFWLKWETDADYYQVFEYELGYTPLGLIQIWGMGHTEGAGLQMIEQGKSPLEITAGNFSVDNIKISNLDAQKQVVKVEFKTNRREIPPDFVYTDTWSDEDLLINVLKKEK